MSYLVVFECSFSCNFFKQRGVANFFSCACAVDKVVLEFDLKSKSNIAHQCLKFEKLTFIVFYTEDQLRCAHNMLSDCPTMHIDATGCVTTKWSKKPVFLYACVFQTKMRGEPCLPVMELITDNHTGKNLACNLFRWKLNADVHKIKPEIICIDFSWALI